MSTDVESRHFTPAGGNVFADLGFEVDEAEALKVESDRIISEKMAIKEALMTEIATWIDEQHLKQTEAAIVLGITRPRVSDVVKKKAIKFSIDSLVDMVTRTGKQVMVSVQS